MKKIIVFSTKRDGEIKEFLRKGEDPENVIICNDLEEAFQKSLELKKETGENHRIITYRFNVETEDYTPYSPGLGLDPIMGSGSWFDLN